MASFVVPLPCGIPWLTGGIFSSEAARRRAFPLSFVLDAASHKVVLATADRAARPKPQAELIPTQVVMHAAPSCVAAASPEVADDKLESPQAEGEVQLTAARERAMADVAATLRALRAEVAEQEATDRAAAEEQRVGSDGDEDAETESMAETEWEVISEASVEAFPIHASC